MVNSMEWIILFGGAGREACVLRMLNEGVKVLAIIIPTIRSAKLELAVSKLRGLPCEVIEVDKDSLSSVVSTFYGNSLLSIGFPYLLPSHLLKHFQPAINMHPTLLPRYRGATTGAYILINNEQESGSTVHHLTEYMDRGDIVRQTKVRLTPFDTVRSVQRKVYECEAQLLIEALDLLECGAKPYPQNETSASEYPQKRTPAHSKIDPTLSLLDLFNTIRACDSEEFPAYFIFHGEKVCIKLWRPDKPSSESDLI